MLARALFIPLSFLYSPYLAIVGQEMVWWIEHGQLQEWIAIVIAKLRQPTVGSLYSFNITPDMPTPGGTSPIGTKEFAILR